MAAYVVGGAFIGLGLSGLVAHSRPGGWALWVGGAVVAHDGLLTPVVLLAGLLVRRWRRFRLWLFVAGVLTLVALPLVLGLGRHPDNPSILPLHYLPNLIVAVTLVAVATAFPWRRAGQALAAGFANSRRGCPPRGPAGDSRPRPDVEGETRTGRVDEQHTGRAGEQVAGRVDEPNGGRSGHESSGRRDGRGAGRAGEQKSGGTDD
ncbi:hypothetical protein [Actinomadura oligospora]|uniref:hypothetical protein n=1 Tax=Actinomadura oligospora TaxID=111804 RepID=UPI001B80A831|nr:hypothetical protein [Actinomadura oligospora]